MRPTHFAPADRRAAARLEALLMLAWAMLLVGAAYVGGQWLLQVLVGSLTVPPPILHAV
jgi:hypothetical protein